VVVVVVLLGCCYRGRGRGCGEVGGVGGCDGQGEVARAVTRAQKGGACGGGMHGNVARAVTRA
jgi:hypothetical protein